MGVLTAGDQPCSPGSSASALPKTGEQPCCPASPVLAKGNCWRSEPEPPWGVSLESAAPAASVPQKPLHVLIWHEGSTALQTQQ